MASHIHPPMETCDECAAAITLRAALERLLDALEKDAQRERRLRSIPWTGSAEYLDARAALAAAPASGPRFVGGTMNGHWEAGASGPGLDVVHMCPPDGSGVMPCCGRTPFEATSDRMTLDPALVTCHGRVGSHEPQGPDPRRVSRDE